MWGNRMIRPNLAAKTRALTAAANPLPVSACENDSRAVTEIAERLTILRSAEPAGWQQPDRPTRTFLKPGRPAGPGQARRTTWRLAAPVLSGLAVAAVLVSLTMAGAGGTHAARPAPSCAASGGQLQAAPCCHDQRPAAERQGDRTRHADWAGADVGKPSRRCRGRDNGGGSVGPRVLFRRSRTRPVDEPE